MAKRSNVRRSSRKRLKKAVEEKGYEIAETPEEFLDKTVIDTDSENIFDVSELPYVLIRCIYPAIMKMKRSSDPENPYVFNGAGSVVKVAPEDSEDMINMRRGTRPCCGGVGGDNVIFERI